MLTAKIIDWAQHHRIPSHAVDALIQILRPDPSNTISPVKGESESAVQAAVRIEAARKGVYLWRNNVGAYIDDKGRQVRYGLANESKAVNIAVKSGDLIGFRPITITPHHIGQVIGQFVSRECKAVDWKYRGTEREQAQLAWVTIVTLNGGDAQFCNGEGTL